MRHTFFYMWTCEETAVQHMSRPMKQVVTRVCDNDCVHLKKQVFNTAPLSSNSNPLLPCCVVQFGVRRTAWRDIYTAIPKHNLAMGWSWATLAYH